MATTIRWIDNSSVEQGHRIYKSDTYFTKDNLPPMLVELGADVEEYVDEDGEDGENWYIVSAFINDHEVFSEPFISGLSTAFIHDVFGDGSAVATYRFDGDATDLGGKFDGLWNGFSEYGEGLLHRSAKFTGNNFIETNSGYVEAESFSLWFKTDNLSSTTRRIIEIPISESRFISLWVYMGRMGIVDPTYSSSSVTYISNDRWSGEWAHISYSSPDRNFYYNTEIMETSNTYNNGAPTPVNIRIGADQNGGRVLTDAKIDQLRIFNRVLTEEEVQTLYEEGAAFL